MLENLTTEEAKEYAGIEGKGSQQKQSAFRLRIVKAKLKSVKDEWCHETKEGTIDIKKRNVATIPGRILRDLVDSPRQDAAEAQ